MQVAQDLGIAVDERPVTWDEVASGTFVECGLCGTAAVISPVGEIHDDDTVVVFPDGHESSGPVMKRLRETLTGIQGGQIEDKHGWVCKICGYVYEGETLPADFICPLCKHGAEDFEKLPE